MNSILSLTDVNEVVSKFLQKERGKPLKDAEKLVLYAAWNSLDYEEVVLGTNYKLNYLQRNLAPNLWNLLTKLLSSNDKVDKKSFRRLIEQNWSRIQEKNEDNNINSNLTSENVQVIGQIPDTTIFYGRVSELKELKLSLESNLCVFLTGATGIGKSALASKLIEIITREQPDNIKFIIWKTLYQPCTVETLINDLIELIDEPRLAIKKSISINEKVHILLEILKKKKCLIILDNAGSLFDTNQYVRKQAEIDRFKDLIGKLVSEEHKSCLLVICQYSLPELKYLEYSGLKISSIKLKGLDLESSKKILLNSGMPDSKLLDELFYSYRGNPRILYMVAHRIKTIYGSNLGQELESKTTLGLSIILITLDSIFQELSHNDKLALLVLFCLFNAKGSGKYGINFQILLDLIRKELDVTVSDSSLIDVLEKLQNYHLVELINDEKKGEVNFSLQPLIEKYISLDPMKYIKNSLKIKNIENS